MSSDVFRTNPELAEQYPSDLDARWSALTVQDSARLGVKWLPGIGLTRASCMAYRTQNGVRTPTTSAGSNQAGAKVTYNAQRISPSGLVCAAAGSARPPASRRESTITHARASLDFRCMLSFLP